MLNGILGQKSSQIQGFLEDGKRIPLTVVQTLGNTVSQVKTTEKEGYNAVQISLGNKKKANKAEAGHSKKAGMKQTPRFLKELRLDDVAEIKAGTEIVVSEIFQPGDIIDVVGVSKGKGFAGGVKRHHFKGGPRTHGQSDRERAPGSIGQTTTPGRVYKGKRMASRMGHETVTVKNLQVIEIKEDGTMLLKGLVPGPLKSLIIIKKVGESKKFIPLYKELPEETPLQEVSTEQVAEPEVVIEDKPTEEVVETQAEAVKEDAVVLETQTEVQSEMTQEVATQETETPDEPKAKESEETETSEVIEETTEKKEDK
jgi:large subunit ribosomal protein L3